MGNTDSFILLNMRFSYIFENLRQKNTKKIHVYRLLSDTLPLSTHRLPPIQRAYFRVQSGSSVIGSFMS